MSPVAGPKMEVEMAGEWQEILARGSYYPGDWVRPRYNPGTWMAMVDLAEIFPGHRSITRDGDFVLFDGAVGVDLRVERSEQSEPFLSPEKEWEAERPLSPSYIWKEDGKLHMLYEVGYEISCYAISEDGYHWERPVLGLTEFNGSRENNILQILVPASIFKDPTAPPGERYKAMGGRGIWLDRETGEEVDPAEADPCWRAEQYEGRAYSGRKVVLKGALEGYTSPDRLNWTKNPEPLADYSVNGGLSPGYDPHNETYYAFMQPQGVAPLDPSLGTGVPETEVVRRSIGLARTRDFRHWPAPKLLIHPDAQDPLDISFYGPCYCVYPGRRDLHVMILSVFHQVTGHVDLQIAFSRDGLLWTRPERRPVATVGPAGSGEDCQLHAWRHGLVELPDGSWAVHYQGHSLLHNSRPALFPQARTVQNHWACWRPHRLCGVEAESEGRFTIPTVFRRGKELRLNYRCAPGGWIRVELLQMVPAKNCPDVDPLEGFTFTACDPLGGDEEDQVVTWRGNSDISSVGEMVGIRVEMFQAKLFAYKI